MDEPGLLFAATYQIDTAASKHLFLQYITQEIDLLPKFLKKVGGEVSLHPPMINLADNDDLS